MEGKASRVSTGEVRLHYVHLSEPYSPAESAAARYSVLVYLPDGPLLDAVREAESAAAMEGVNGLWDGVMPDLDGVARVDRLGRRYVRPSSMGAPEVAGEVYSGCYGKVVFDVVPVLKKGVAYLWASLVSVEKTRDGEPQGAPRAAGGGRP
ncbi:MAG: DUF2815 family protein [Eggerthellaceae bacterium]|nr:DUF2815 family protein [Eggerthellaceae bacterium]